MLEMSCSLASPCLFVRCVRRGLSPNLGLTISARLASSEPRILLPPPLPPVIVTGVCHAPGFTQVLGFKLRTSQIILYRNNQNPGLMLPFFREICPCNLESGGQGATMPVRSSLLSGVVIWKGGFGCGLPSSTRCPKHYS